MCCENCCTNPIQEEPPTSGELLRQDHESKCIGIQVMGNTANFCSCISNAIKIAIIQLRDNNYQDILERLIKASDSGFVAVGDVEFLISENRKWS